MVSLALLIVDDRVCSRCSLLSALHALIFCPLLFDCEQEGSREVLTPSVFAPTVQRHFFWIADYAALGLSAHSWVALLLLLLIETVHSVVVGRLLNIDPWLLSVISLLG